MEALPVAVAAIFLLAIGATVYMYGNNSPPDIPSDTQATTTSTSTWNPCGSGVVLDHWRQELTLREVDGYYATLEVNITYSGTILNAQLKYNPLNYEHPFGAEDEANPSNILLYIDGELYGSQQLPSLPSALLYFNVPTDNQVHALELYTCGR